MINLCNTDSIKMWFLKIHRAGRSLSAILSYKWRVFLNANNECIVKNVGTGRSLYDGHMHTGRGIKQNGNDQTITLPVNATINTIAYFQDGVLIIDETLQTLTNYVTDVNSSSVFQNFIFSKGTWTSVQKAEFKNNPELFLYHEQITENQVDTVTIDTAVNNATYAIRVNFDTVYSYTSSSSGDTTTSIATNLAALVPNAVANGNKIIITSPISGNPQDVVVDVSSDSANISTMTTTFNVNYYTAKSKILNQIQIDNIVAHYPMTEQFGMIPFTTTTSMNMMNVSSKIVHLRSSNISNNSGFTVNNGIITADGTQADYSASAVMLNNMKVGHVYIMTINIITADDFANVGLRFDPYTFIKFTGMGINTLGTHSFYFIPNSTKMYNRYWAKNGWKGSMELIYIQEVICDTAIITNVTRSSSAYEQTKGLQSCLWYRDSGGVPTGLVEHGVSFGNEPVNYYGKGNFIRNNEILLSDTESIQFEIVYYIDVAMGRKNHGWRIGDPDGGKIGIGLYAPGTKVYAHASGYGLFMAKQIYQDQYVHVVFTANTVTGKTTGFINGNQQGSANITFTTHDAHFDIVGSDNVVMVNIYKGTKNLQDPVQLYNTAKTDLANKGITI